MKKRTRWSTIRKTISKTLHISEDILDFLSNYDILIASVSGTSNQDISKNLDIDEKEVRKTIGDYIGTFCGGWEGFEESSEISPYYVFKTVLGKWARVSPEEEFTSEMQKLTGSTEFLGIDHHQLYNILFTFTSVRYRILAKYRKEDYGNYIRRNT